VRPIEFNAAIGRTQDFTQQKVNEDTKPAVEQQQIVQSNEKTIEHKSQMVSQHDDGDMDAEYDASKEGRGGYEGESSGRKRKDEEENDDGKVVIKQKATFDIKI